ncbi:unnamed protein product [Zymoseptoria tritici ST99CH_1A5]|uniref:Borealin N-terminal domain-containing protein n=3 Tax=Zymoseptoria tritici TaxID=1047171 RepID=F9X0F8_ZYMTI|nr:uncharacterized protein MYCGRDRAFT_107505 [Zymoseptoria tritici IPO323]EGP91535.1 hypothetical protein MYCGRDRAFT_107505 [Zymoseptoria tritici IPO323]SMR42787.1 unnamed protein product [Zymoseptoria tritici ST99CH_1E4]SMR44958.1 unnamed protein product [Zymoseptoria tritici ST99CH_3D1]SMY20122.1 unnamed protein product [Zymoseptoria tritici ST99CH_1A5]
MASYEQMPSMPANNDTNTPERSPARRPAGITQAQKQALIDNLQLELTERARKLRAQTALQAQGLRARLEMRVNRIPQGLRKRNIQELVDEHNTTAKPAPPAAMPIVARAQAAQAPQSTLAKTKQASKRKSEDISMDEDKENEPSENPRELANPKKRTKTTAATANSKATRTISRKPGPSGVLSPKSHNSRTLPHPPAPFKPSALSPEKTQPTRPTSAAQHAVPKATRAPSRQTKRAVAPQSPDNGRVSEGSAASAATTIMSNAKTGTTKKAAVPRKAATAKAATAGRKPAVPKQEPVASTGRTLRKRN